MTLVLTPAPSPWNGNFHSFCIFYFDGFPERRIQEFGLSKPRGKINIGICLQDPDAAGDVGYKHESQTESSHCGQHRHVTQKSRNSTAQPR